MGPGSRASEAAYGQRSFDCLAKFDPDTSSWRTFQLSLFGGLDEFSGTWPRSGMTRSGTVFRLPTLAPLTDAIGSGLWPTPVRKQGGTSEQCLKGAAVGLYHMTLDRAVALALQGKWPTPTAMDCHVAESFETWSARVERTGYSHVPLRLAAKALDIHSVYGHLNPTWVEWLMGYPINWTALKD